MTFAYSLDGILYNLPALLVLAYLLWRRPVLGAVLVGAVWARVIEQAIPFSMHAVVAGVAMTALNGWRMAIGGVLVLYTAWWYLLQWHAPHSFWMGLGVGVAVGIIARIIDWVGEEGESW
ncbi:MAG: hypothetical protein BRD55_08000 [Bacteroidetes bacterium SW_9_63_38]|nr:MAG: hypothetical protein BRD55_08000 [Bacteroidetes bacterium SW_9_63_38]